MIEILDLLFPYLSILYFIDCIQYLRQNHLLFYSVGGKRFNLKRAGLHLIHLSPIGRCFISHSIPVMYSRHGLYLLKDQERHAEDFDLVGKTKFISYREMEEVESDGDAVKINGISLLNLPSSICARRVAVFLDNLKTANPENRLAKIQIHLKDAFDLVEIASRRTNYSSHLFFINILAGFLFFHIFGILPLMLYTKFYHMIDATVVVFNMALTYVLIVGTMIYLHQKLYPAERVSRLYTVLTLVFSPVSALHAVSHLTKTMLSGFDYLALSSQFLAPDDFQELVRKELYKTEYMASQKAGDDWATFWEAKKSVLHDFIEQAGMSIETLSAIPQKQDKSASSYCPYCLTEYVTKGHKCVDCGVRVKTFERDLNCF